MALDVGHMKMNIMKVRDQIERITPGVWIFLTILAGVPIIGHIQRLRLPDDPAFHHLRTEAMWMLPCQTVLFLTLLCIAIFRCKTTTQEPNNTQEGIGDSAEPSE